MEQTWIRGPVIGRGATATVSLASTLSDPQRRFAVKSSDISRSVSLQNEHNILSKIGHHPNLITTFGLDVSEGHCNLLTEYISGGTLAGRIRNHENGRLNETMIRFYTFNILMGLDFLHANGVVHCDIKSENVLIGNDGIVKIADLGFSKTDGMQRQSVFCGTPAFMSPEVARGEVQGFAADIWALGCTIVEMATGKNPWPEETDPISALYKIGYSGNGPTIPSTLSEKGRDFVGKCLIRNPTERWTARELLKHPFVAELNVTTTNVEESSLIKKDRSSPTCVLDLAFWDQLDDDQNDDDCSSSERIGRLDSGPPSTSSWDFDENWITVRTNSSYCRDDRIDMTRKCKGSGTGRSVEEEIGSSDMMLDSANGEDGCVLLLNFFCNHNHLCKQESLSLIR